MSGHARVARPLIALAITLLVPASTSAQTGLISGRVTGADTGLGLASVTVRAYPTGGGTTVSTTTNAAGDYVITGAAVGTYRVATANNSGYINELYDNIPCADCWWSSSATSVAVTAGSTSGGIDFVLTRGGLITGRVTAEATGLGISYVSIDAYDSDGSWAASAVTDANGNYTTRTGLPTGSYRVVTKNLKGYLDEAYGNVPCMSCSGAVGSAVSVTAGATTANVHFALAVGGKISGTVTDETTGLPLSGINLSIYYGARYVTSGYTDAAGRYTSTLGLAAGKYLVYTSNSKGYVNEVFDNIPCMSCGISAGGTPVAVAVGATTASIDFALAPGGRITGTVTDAATGTPLAYVSMNVHSSSGQYVASANTNESGVYTTSTGLPNGSYFVSTSVSPGSAYLDEVYDTRLCATACPVTSGTPVAVSTGGTTRGIDFALTAGGRIGGTVTDASTGLPISDVSVYVLDMDGSSVESMSTEADGRYLSGGLAPGSYFVQTYSNAGYLDETWNDVPCCSGTTATPVSVAAGVTTASIDFALTPGARITGTVTDVNTGLPLAHVDVTAYGTSGSDSAETDAAGHFTLGASWALPTGAYRVHTRNALGYLDEAYDNVQCVNCSGLLGISIAATAGGTTAGINFALSPGGRIGGLITDATTGQPIPDVRVAVFDANGVAVGYGSTDESGVYASTGLFAGSYFVRASPYGTAGHLDEVWNDVLCLQCDVRAGSPVPVTLGHTTGGINFALVPGGRITGTVTDADGQPMQGVYVNAYAASTGRSLGGASASTNSAGVYEVGSLPTGTYFVEILGSDHYIDQTYNRQPCRNCAGGVAAPVSVTAGTTTTNINFTLVAGGRIRGRVTDAVTGAPLSGVSMSIYDASGSNAGYAYTDSGGAYETSDGLVSGTYYVVTNNWGGHLDEVYSDLPCFGSCRMFGTFGTPIRVKLGSTVEHVDFALSPGGRIRGRVSDAGTGEVLPGVEVQALSGNGDTVAYDYSDSAGTFTIDGLPTGSYQVRTHGAPGHIDELWNDVPCPACVGASGALVTVVAGATTPNTDFALDLGGTIAGTVTDAITGFPVQDAEVDIYTEEGAYAEEALTDGTGAWTTRRGLATGAYRVRAHGPGDYVPEAWNDVPCLDCPATSGAVVAVTAGSTTSGIAIALARGGTITGRVTDATTGLPLSDVMLEVFDAQGRRVTYNSTDGDGVYRTKPGLPAGNYYVRTTGAEGFIDEAWNDVPCIDCSGAFGTPVTVAAGTTTQGIDMALANGGRISGLVIDAGTGWPVPGVSLVAYDAAGRRAASAYTDNSGRFATLAGLPGGTYFMRTTNSAGYLDEAHDDVPCVACPVTTGTPISVTAAATTGGITFALERGGRISGRVTKEGTGEVLTEIEVRVFTPGGELAGRASTDDSGQYVVERGLAPGGYFVATRASAFFALPVGAGPGGMIDSAYVNELYLGVVCPACAYFDLARGVDPAATFAGATLVPVQLGQTTRNVDFSLASGARLGGTITDALTTAALPSVKIDVVDGHGALVATGTTGADGRFVTEGAVPPGTYHLYAGDGSTEHVRELYDNVTCPTDTCPGGTPVVVSPAAHVTGLDINLAHGGTIRGTVTSAATGAPIASVGVEVVNSSGTLVAEASSRFDGTYVSPALPDGTYHARTTFERGWAAEIFQDVPCASPMCLPSSGTAITISAGSQVTGVDFTLAAGATLTPLVTTLATGLNGVPFDQRLLTKGGAGAYHYAVTCGALPPGVSLDPATGAMGGAPAASGTFAFVITTVDDTGASVEQAYALTVVDEVVRYLSEGATGPFFDLTLALLNTSTVDGSATFEFQRSDGTVISRVLPLPALTRRTLTPEIDVPGLATAAFSTLVRADVPIVMDRTMSWDDRGYGVHTESSVAEPSAQWYLAEGATHSGFDLFYLIQNSWDTELPVEVTYLRPAPQAPLVKTYVVPATSRFNIWVDLETFATAAGPKPLLANTDVSAVLRSADGRPFIVERAMYLGAGDRLWDAGHNSAGICRPRTQWFLAEGATGRFFDLFVLIANPGEQAATVRATYLLPDGTSLIKDYEVDPSSRFNIWVDMEELPPGSGLFPLNDTAVSVTLTSLNGVPIIVERAMWWPGPTAATWEEAHNSPGATAAGTRWALAGGEVGGPRNIETYILLANTSAFDATIRVTILFEDGSRSAADFPVRASSRYNVPVSLFFTESAGRRFGAIVESQGDPPAQIVVETAMYWDADGRTWSAGGNALATRLQ